MHLARLAFRLGPIVLTCATFVVGLLVALPADAFPGLLTAWKARYGAVSTAGQTAGCQLCHAQSNGGASWNAYGWDLFLAREDLGCDKDANGSVSNDEAFACIELLQSDADPAGIENGSEIGISSQPGWTIGANNVIYTVFGTTPGQTAPASIGTIDPDRDADGVLDPVDNCLEDANGALAGPNVQLDADGDGIGNVCDADLNQDGFVGIPDFGIMLPCYLKSVGPGKGPAGDPECRESDMDGNGVVQVQDFLYFLFGYNAPPGPVGAKDGRSIHVWPGQSIQAAIDRAAEYTRIYVRPGTYKEGATSTNGLSITKNGIKLIGMSSGADRVVVQKAQNQRNGMVIVPSIVTDCMSCHSSMAPPFDLLPGVPPGLPDPHPLLYDIEVSGITIDGFRNNGLFTERVDRFKIIDVASINNKNYGIFPTLSRNGLIKDSYASDSDDSGIWVETSENVQVVNNLVENNVNGFEVSNSDGVVLSNNVSRYNTVGAAILLLPDIFDDRPGAKRIHLRDNQFLDNNKPNTASPGSILATVPSGIGVLYLGVDDSEVARNRIEGNNASGLAIVDYCLAVGGSDFSCDLDPTVTPEFIADSFASRIRTVDNVMIGNGLSPDPSHPFAFVAADLSVVSFSPDHCYRGNVFTTLFQVLVAPLPVCP
ncbi:MAG: right-handed parallel beta-helix repeat-containing protein [Deltaproteobacteria bacterium]|nr:right-handed parallel beta-helix repeat-containing protein [Deltaproteobacteria bacterium]